MNISKMFENKKGEEEGITGFSKILFIILGIAILVAIVFIMLNNKNIISALLSRGYVK